MISRTLCKSVQNYKTFKRYQNSVAAELLVVILSNNKYMETSINLESFSNSTEVLVKTAEGIYSATEVEDYGTIKNFQLSHLRWRKLAGINDRLYHMIDSTLRDKSSIESTSQDTSKYNNDSQRENKRKHEETIKSVDGTDQLNEQDVTIICRPCNEDVSMIDTSASTSELPLRKNRSNEPCDEEVSTIDTSESTSELPPRKNHSNEPCDEEVSTIDTSESTSELPPRKNHSNEPCDEEVSTIDTSASTSELPPRKNHSNEPCDEEVSTIDTSESTSELPPRKNHHNGQDSRQKRKLDNSPIGSDSCTDAIMIIPCEDDQQYYCQLLDKTIYDTGNVNGISTRMTRFDKCLVIGLKREIFHEMVNQTTTITDQSVTSWETACPCANFQHPEEREHGSAFSPAKETPKYFNEEKLRSPSMCATDYTTHENSFNIKDDNETIRYCVSKKQQQCAADIHSSKFIHRVLAIIRSPTVLCEQYLFTPKTEENEHWDINQASVSLFPVSPCDFMTDISRRNVSDNHNLHQSYISDSNRSDPERICDEIDTAKNINVTSDEHLQRTSVPEITCRYQKQVNEPRANVIDNDKIDVCSYNKLGFENLFKQEEIKEHCQMKRNLNKFPNPGTGDVIEPKIELRVFGNEYIPSFFSNIKSQCKRKIMKVDKEYWGNDYVESCFIKNDSKFKPRAADLESVHLETESISNRSQKVSSNGLPQKSRSEMGRVLDKFEMEDRKGIGPLASMLNYKYGNPQKDNRNLFKDEIWNSCLSQKAFGTLFKKNKKEKSVFKMKIKASLGNVWKDKEEFSKRKGPYSKSRYIMPKGLKRSKLVNDLSTIGNNFLDIVPARGKKEECTNVQRDILIIDHQDEDDQVYTENKTDVLSSDKFPSYITCGERARDERENMNKIDSIQKISVESTPHKNVEDMQSETQAYHTGNETVANQIWSNAADDLSPLEQVDMESPFAEYSALNIPSTLNDIHIPVLDPTQFEVVKDKNGFDIMVGSGGYGNCYLASRETWTRKVVIKEFQDGIRGDEIIHEARVLRYLWDTGIVPECIGIMSSDSFLSFFVLVQEYYGRGITLKDLINERNIEPSTRDWLNIAHQLVSGLEFIHGKHVLLNDIKSDNVLVDTDKRNFPIRYIDMGVASFRSGFIYPCSREYLKKYFYLAPEVRRREPSTTASDVFSLGQMFKQINSQAGIIGLGCLYLDCVEDYPRDRPTLKTLEKEIRKFIIFY